MLGGLCVAAMGAVSVPAAAKVASVSDRGFVVQHLVEVPVAPDEAWATLLKPAEWWDSDHTWSGDAANLSIDPKAGGCFCEVLPNETSPRAAPRGSVEHMRVVYIERPRVLRMVGALGPLQGDALGGTMTIQLRPEADGEKTQLLLEYVVGGYSRTAFDKLAGAVDQMLGEQLRGYAAKFGGAFEAAFPMPDETAAQEASPLPKSDAIPGVLPLPENPPEVDGKEVIGR
ncbi:polyketide cyclase [Novosphingobium malaysiense]|uniref:Polyketide cyclase n=1 Tax=Novosphingobium malaysiense TaxID=1348853 RepID=A0A0B1ZN70_9SPHN|nr:polyketide cyclase [Novosphingobium malaysiense]